MSGIGIDISRQESKHPNVFLDQRFGYVITVCDRADERCPIFPGDPIPVHWSYPDLAAATGGQVAMLKAFRKVRDELRERLRLWILTQRH